MSDEAKTDRELLLETRQDVRFLVESRRDHETRIRTVEKQVWWFSGIVAAFAAALKIFGGKQ